MQWKGILIKKKIATVFRSARMEQVTSGGFRIMRGPERTRDETNSRWSSSKDSLG